MQTKLLKTVSLVGVVAAVYTENDENNLGFG